METTERKQLTAAEIVAEIKAGNTVTMPAARAWQFMLACERLGLVIEFRVTMERGTATLQPC